MGRLVVLEGLDGAGKNTLAGKLTTALTARGASVARVAFPRYGDDVHADLARDALYGRLGDMADSVHGMAVLFALDRRGAAAEITATTAEHDVLLADRYVASNAAYGAARLHQDADGDFVTWVRHLEIDRFALPVPNLQLLLNVPPEVAAGRASGRASNETGRQRDAFEVDDGLQQRCAAVYRQLADAGWLAPWLEVDGAAAAVDVDPIADAVLR